MKRQVDERRQQQLRKEYKNKQKQELQQQQQKLKKQKQEKMSMIPNLMNIKINYDFIDNHLIGIQNDDPELMQDENEYKNVEDKFVDYLAMSNDKKEHDRKIITKIQAGQVQKLYGPSLKTKQKLKFNKKNCESSCNIEQLINANEPFMKSLVTNGSITVKTQNKKEVENQISHKTGINNNNHDYANSAQKILTTIEKRIKVNPIWKYCDKFHLDPNILLTIPEIVRKDLIPLEYQDKFDKYLTMYQKQIEEKETEESKIAEEENETKIKKNIKSNIGNDVNNNLLLTVNVDASKTNCYVRIINRTITKENGYLSYSDHTAHAEKVLLENLAITKQKRKSIYWELYNTSKKEKYRQRTRKELDHDMAHSIRTEGGKVTSGSTWMDSVQPKLLSKMQNLRLSVMDHPFNNDILIITIFSNLSTAKDTMDCLIGLGNCFIQGAKFKLANDLNQFIGLDCYKICECCFKNVDKLKICSRCSGGPKVCSDICGKKLWKKKRDNEGKEIGQYGHICIGCRQFPPKDKVWF